MSRGDPGGWAHDVSGAGREQALAPCPCPAHRGARRDGGDDRRLVRALRDAARHEGTVLACAVVDPRADDVERELVRAGLEAAGGQGRRGGRRARTAARPRCSNRRSSRRCAGRPAAARSSSSRRATARCCAVPPRARPAARSSAPPERGCQALASSRSGWGSATSGFEVLWAIPAATTKGGGDRGEGERGGRAEPVDDGAGDRGGDGLTDDDRGPEHRHGGRRAAGRAELGGEAVLADQGRADAAAEPASASTMVSSERAPA